MTDTPEGSTARQISPDSGTLWTEPGAWKVADGVFRIPLPLPMDGLRAVNVYVLETDDGLVLIDGGWAIPVSREIFERLEARPWLRRVDGVQHRLAPTQAASP